MSVDLIADFLSAPLPHMRRSHAARRRWKNPEYRQKVIETSRKTNGERMRSVVGPASKTPEARRKTSETMKRLWADPKFRVERMLQLRFARREKE